MSDTVDRLVDKVEAATKLGTAGYKAAGFYGGLVGGTLGFILGDEEIVFPVDMIAIPAYQAHMLVGSPAMQVYIRAGETLVPTGGNVEDVQSVVAENLVTQSPQPKKKKSTAYQRKYKAAFKKVKSKHKKKNGQWKKGGFKAAVKEAHRIAGGKK
jgi:hypothetical protein